MQACTLILGAVLLAGGSAFAEGKEAKKGAAPKGMDPQAQAMMEAWQKAATPGPAHQRLKAMAGSFDTVTRVWMQPGAPVQESKGRCDSKMIFDGRFLSEDFKGTMDGKPFTGVGTTGYDNVKKKYVGTWMDSMSTSLTYFEGSFDEAGKVLTTTMKSADAMTGKDVPHRGVTRIESDAKHVFEMWRPGPDGKEFKSMEIIYTRSK